MAAHARLDPVQRMLTEGEQGLFDQRVVLPPTYYAAVTAVMKLSPATLRNEDKVREWLDVFEFSATPISAGERAQLGVSAQLADRLTAYPRIRVPTLVIGFADDVTVLFHWLGLPNLKCGPGRRSSPPRGVGQGRRATTTSEGRA
jgi:hypothetical protein